MGIVLNWNSGYTGVAGSEDDTVTNFPTVTDGVHDVMASHVNELASAVIQLQTIQTTLSPLEVLDEGGSLSTGVTSIDFVGSGVTATNVGDDITVTITSGASDLDAVINSATADNTVNIPDGDELNFSDNAVDLTNDLLSITRSGAGPNLTHSINVDDNRTSGTAVSLAMAAPVGSGTVLELLRGSGGNAISLALTDGTTITQVDETRLYATNADFTIQVQTDDLFFSARGSGNIPFNEAGDVSLDGGFTATSIIGALNELLASGGGGTLQDAYNAGETITVAASTPIALTTSASNEDGITITDTTDTMTLRGNQIIAPQGAASDPSYSFGISTNLGMYAVSNVIIGFATAGSLRMQMSSLALYPGSPGGMDLGTTSNQWDDVYANNTYLSNGTASVPAHSFENDTNTGMYSAGADIIGFTSGGGQVAAMQRVLNALSGEEIGLDLSFSATAGGTADWQGVVIDVADTSTNSGDTNIIDMRAGGTSVKSVTIDGYTRAPDGTAATPSYAFGSAADMGFYAVASAVLGVAVSGAGRVRISTTAIRSETTEGMTLGTSGVAWGNVYTARVLAEQGAAATPSISFNDDDNTGLFNTVADEIAVTLGGTQTFDFTGSAFSPTSDNSVSLGESGLRFSDVYAVTTTIGDLNLHSLNDDAKWTMVEDERGLFLISENTGKAYQLSMTEVPRDTAPKTAKELGYGSKN